MKKLYFTFLVACYCTALLANPIDADKARRIAVSILGDNVASSSSAKGDKTQGECSPYYIYNTVNNQGFAIITGDDEFPNVIGYSHSGNIDKSNMPPALTEFLQQYANYVKAVQNGEASAPTPLLTTSNFPSEVAPMLTCAWGQGAPYNALCPEGTLVGCVATAIAQIMYYYKWPEKGTGSGYTTYNGTALSVNFSNNTYDWAAMKDNTNDNKADETASAAVARISYDSGIASKMNYGAQSAAYTYDAVKALYTNFGYNASSIRLLLRDCYATQDEWMELVKTELANGHPLYYSATSPTGGGSDAGGHAFVVDGYNEDNLVHVNWGWNGQCDGYYDIVRLNPKNTSYSFSSNQDMIVGLTPCKDGESGSFVPHPYMDRGISTESTSVEYTDNGSTDFTISTPIVENITAVTAKWTIGIGLYNTNGTFIKKISNISHMVSLNTLHYVVASSYPCKLPSGLEDGEYFIKMYFAKGSEHIEPDVLGGQQNNCIHTVISNGKATFDKDITTGIKHFNMIKTTDTSPVYFLDGRKVGASLYNLPQGIYVTNGKKIAVGKKH